MKANLNKLSLRTGIPGIVLQYGGAVVVWDYPILGFTSVLIGTFLIAVGIGLYIKAKARSIGYLFLGLVPVLGLVAIACLDDRSSYKQDPSA